MYLFIKQMALILTLMNFSSNFNLILSEAILMKMNLRETDFIQEYQSINNNLPISLPHVGIKQRDLFDFTDVANLLQT